MGQLIIKNRIFGHYSFQLITSEKDQIKGKKGDHLSPTGKTNIELEYTISVQFFELSKHQ